MAADSSTMDCSISRACSPSHSRTKASFSSCCDRSSGSFPFCPLRLIASRTVARFHSPFTKTYDASVASTISDGMAGSGFIGQNAVSYHGYIVYDAKSRGSENRGKPMERSPTCIQLGCYGRWVDVGLRHLRQRGQYVVISTWLGTTYMSGVRLRFLSGYPYVFFAQILRRHSPWSLTMLPGERET